jgi:DNA protecting protein DprA
MRGFASTLSENDMRRYVAEVKRLQSDAIEIVSIMDDEYPPLLRRIRDPPLVLYKKGLLRRFERCISVIGTRAASHYAHKMARVISQHLASNGFIVTSGLARGIDTEAHCGALDVGGVTVAVLGLSIDSIYPPENSELAVDIANNGALLSETRLKFPRKNLESERRNFVFRNRITSGMSICTVIVESGETGGSFSQFKVAKAQGRPVFVMEPVNQHRVAREGFDAFVSHGAKTFRNLEELSKMIEQVEREQLIGIAPSTPMTNDLAVFLQNLLGDLRSLDENFSVEQMMKALPSLRGRREEFYGMDPAIRKVSLQLSDDLNRLFKILGMKEYGMSRIPGFEVAGEIFIRPESHQLFSRLRYEIERLLS